MIRLGFDVSPVHLIQVKADGVNLLPPECFVAMNRFSVAPGQEAAFEQRCVCNPLSEVREQFG